MAEATEVTPRSPARKLRCLLWGPKTDMEKGNCLNANWLSYETEGCYRMTHRKKDKGSDNKTFSTT